MRTASALQKLTAQASKIFDVFRTRAARRQVASGPGSDQSPESPGFFEDKEPEILDHLYTTKVQAAATPTARYSQQ